MRSHKEFISNFSKRLVIVFIGIAIAVLIIISRLMFLQVFNNQKYQLLSDNNRIRLELIIPNRAKILDRNGEVLAYDKIIYSVYLYSDTVNKFKMNLNALSEYIDIPNAKEVLETNKQTQRNVKILIKKNLNWEEYSKLIVNSYKLHGLFIENENIRVYPYAHELSHVIGYIKNQNGQIGIEKFLDEYLFGEIGKSYFEVNAFGKKVRLIEEIHDKKAENLMLSIDIKLQKHVYDLIAPHKAGCAIVVDLQNGEILSCVSYPSFDNNIFNAKIAHKDWNEIINHECKPLNNRVFYNVYPLGSVFKLVVAYAALDLKIIDTKTKIHCNGSYKYGTSTFNCWNHYGHGSMDIYNALKQSCDCFFYEIAQKIGIDNLNLYAKMFGFGKLVNVELCEQNAGLIPSKEWKFFRYNTNWKTYETILLGIGQGSLLVNIGQVATLLQCIATGEKCNNFSFLKKSTPVINHHNHDNINLTLNQKKNEYFHKNLKNSILNINCIDVKKLTEINISQQIPTNAIQQLLNFDCDPLNQRSLQHVLHKALIDNYLYDTVISSSKPDLFNTNSQAQSTLNITAESIEKIENIYNEYYQDSIENTEEKFKKEHLEVIRKAMYATCNERHGTAYKSCNAPYKIAGKTSTIQVVNLKKSKASTNWKMQDHAMFLAYAPYGKPKYGVCVFIEHGGGGARVAAPIVRSIFDYLYRNTQNQVTHCK